MCTILTCLEEQRTKHKTNLPVIETGEALEEPAEPEESCGGVTPFCRHSDGIVGHIEFELTHKNRAIIGSRTSHEVPSFGFPSRTR